MIHFTAIWFWKRLKWFILPPFNFENARNGSFYRHSILKTPKIADFCHLYFSLGLKSSISPIFIFRWVFPAPGQPQIFFKTPVPHRATMFWFSNIPSRIGKATFHFRLALSRVRTAIFIFRWYFPASGHPFLFFVGAFPCRDSHYKISLALSRIGATIFNRSTTQNRPVQSHTNHFSAKIT